MHSLPLFVRLAGRRVILVGDGGAADAKRRLLERAGAEVVSDAAEAALAFVALEDAEATEAIAKALKQRGLLVNVVDRPSLCDFTVPAIVDRDPVLVAVGTGGASAGLAAALRQRLETLLPAALGALATALQRSRVPLRRRFPDAGDRRGALQAAFEAGGALDPLAERHDVDLWLEAVSSPEPLHETIILASPDPDDLTLRQARLLARADRIEHEPDVPSAVLDRARADVVRSLAPFEAGLPGLTLTIRMALA